MFPTEDFGPQSKRWVNTVQDTITKVEKTQPMLDSDLAMLQREGRSVMDDVSSQVNAYYTATMAQYPAFQRSLPMQQVLGNTQKVVSISAPAAADNTVAENWVTIFAYTVNLNGPATTTGARLNSAQFAVYGPSAYYLRYRWALNGTAGGIATTTWMSRHQYNLSTFNMSPGPPTIHNVANQFAYWSGTSRSTATFTLQASIQNIANPSASVAAQNITFESVDNNGKDTYLDVMVTV